MAQAITLFAHKHKTQQLWDSTISCLEAMIPLLMVVVTGTAVYLIQTGSATMAAATGWTGKMSAQEGTMVTDLSIRIMMRMKSGSHGIPFKLYNLQ